MNNKQIVRQLNVYYYGYMVLALLTAVGIYLLLTKAGVAVIDPQSQSGVIMQYFLIATALVCIPFGMYSFKRKCRRIRTVEDTDQRQALYTQAARIRIVLVGNTLPIGVGFYYLMGGYQSMLWLAAIAAIALYFCKPTERKIDLELLPDDDSY